MYNIRKNKLDEITKNNYMIYERINQQQSYYNITTMTNSNNSNNHPSQNYSHRSSAHTFLKNTCQYSKFYTIE